MVFLQYEGACGALGRTGSTVLCRKQSIGNVFHQCVYSYASLAWFSCKSFSNIGSSREVSLQSEFASVFSYDDWQQNVCRTSDICKVSLLYAFLYAASVFCFHQTTCHKSNNGRVFLCGCECVFSNSQNNWNVSSNVDMDMVFRRYEDECGILAHTGWTVLCRKQNIGNDFYQCVFACVSLTQFGC